MIRVGVISQHFFKENSKILRVFNIAEHIQVIEFENGCRSICLNREKCLNTIDLQMAKAIIKILNSYKDDPNCKMILITSKVKNFFSVGGDLKVNYGKSFEELCRIGFRFFTKMALLEYIIHYYPKPIVSLVNGTVLGAGISLSFHTKYTVVSENLKFSMPENYVGIVPDNGSSYLIGKLKSVGLYMLLTSARINHLDAIDLNLASNFCPEKNIKNLEMELQSSFEIGSQKGLESILHKHCMPKRFVNLNAGITVKNRNIIEKCFNWGFKTFDEIHKQLKLEAENENLDEDARKFIFNSLVAIDLLVPVSVRTCFELVHRNEGRSLKECLLNEIRCDVHIARRNDLQEGIKRVLLDKTYQPKFDPSTIDQVPSELVEYMFEPLTNSDTANYGDDEYMKVLLESFGEIDNFDFLSPL
ncbi:enoyl-CoA hydratase/isomerase domain-containing protein [Tieghemostelium lacteum]|uniref:Enoyl-CoA hydratase/isomerase domain-containing protein n=1 Tax=Tieghemostelium lacteum TaxID=361077 RepID=A0A151ZRZ5_TIELA|nr:enoyl-CoA hydratase/isomerase domain-containing protein [Tieghemostelium lacteum]|eukprot:KYQ96700.1 enoyl-CoA hydratase/isomerase domain-containing protein [Tieghemostelium lacteum]